MRKLLLIFISSLFILPFTFAQEAEVEEEVFFNTGVTSMPQSIFEDGQPLFASNWEWMHPTPSGSSLYWLQVLDSNTWFMAGAGGTFQKTTDGGATWTVYKEIGGLSSTGFYRTIYDGHFFDTNTGLLCGSSGTLVRTTDGGATWDSVGVGAASSIYDIFFLNDTVGFISGTTTIDVWKTTDAGLTWTSPGGALPGSGYGIWAIDEDTLLVASTSGNIRRSTDGGVTWSSIYVGITETLQDVEMSSATNGWVTGNDGAAAYTTDAGLTWTLANNGLGTTSDYNDVDIFSPSFRGLDDLATVYPQAVPLWTGCTDGVTKTDSSEVRAWDAEDGWMMFDVSSIPAGSTIDSIRFYGYVNATNWPYWSATPLSGLDPRSASADTLKTTIEANSGSGVAYIYSNEGSTFATGWHDYLMGNSANADLEAALAQGWFAMGIDSRDNSPSYYIVFDGWEEANPPYLEVYYTPPGVETVYATGDPFGIMVTTDMGANWTPISHLDPSQAWTGEFFSTDFIDPNNAVTVGTRGMINGWSPSAPMDAGTSYNTWLKSGTLYDIWAESESGRVIAVGAPGISGTTFDQAMYSTDGGETWAIATSDSTPHDFNDLSMVDNMTGYACLEDHFVYKTTDGGVNWNAVTQPAVSTGDLEEIFFVDANTGYTFGASGVGYKTTDGGATWAALTTGVTVTLYSSYFLDANTGYVVGSSGTLLQTTDGGATFTALDPNSTTTLRGIWFVDSNIGYICGSSSNVRKTTDGGATWSTITMPVSTTLYDVEFKDENNGMIVGSSGRTFTTGDGGVTWFFENNSSSTLYSVAIERTSIDTAATYTCGSLAFIMRNAHVIVPVELAGFTASVKGSNVTLNWETATEINNLGFQIERQSNSSWDEIGFVDGHGTTSESNSYSFTDRNLPAGMYNYRIKQIDFDGSYEYYELQNAVEVGAPDNFELSQNYPNPFNPTTKITYSVPVDGFVNLAIYNVLGEKVADLVNTNVKAGSYEVTFDATNFASGMYLYRMESGDFVSIKKMMILK